MPSHPVSNVPRHVAIINDGTRRWGRKHFGDPTAGIKPSFDNTASLLVTAADAGVEVVTAYGWSTENRNRPKSEVEALFSMFPEACRANSEKLHRENIRVRFIGRTEELPEDMRLAISRAERLTARNDRMTTYVAFNYGGQAEMMDAAKKIIQSGVSASDLDKETFSRHLYAPEMPPIDLLVRSGGELRVSNFLLWHLAYAEFYFTDTLWPDFTPAELMEAFEAFDRRSRRYGR